MWVRSSARGWRMELQLTAGSTLNHTYARRPVDARRDFYALWADGHGRQPSESRLYFCDAEGRVFMLPPRMEGELAAPIEVRL